MKLHIEGKDAAKLMNCIDGMGTLRITDDSSKLANCEPLGVWEDRFFHMVSNGRNRREERLSPAYIKEINLDPRCFYVRRELVGFSWATHESLSCKMRAAMRGMGWSGRDGGKNSITVENFIEILWVHTQREGWDIRYIEN